LKYRAPEDYHGDAAPPPADTTVWIWTLSPIVLSTPKVGCSLYSLKSQNAKQAQPCTF